MSKQSRFIRSRNQIILEILWVIFDGEDTRTRIMQEIKMDHRNFKDYFEFLLVKKFVGRKKHPDAGMIYYLTKEGEILRTEMKVVEDKLQ